MQTGLRHILIVIANLLVGCGRADHADQPRDTMAPATATADSQSRTDADATCRVANRSVLARAPNSAAPGPANQRGWISLDQLAVRDSGAAKLIDSDGFSLDGAWRALNDSIVIQASNDFVRIDMRLRLTNSMARGSIRASSDAALERDSAGKLQEFRRSGTISMVRVGCTQLPKPAGRTSRVRNQVDIAPASISR